MTSEWVQVFFLLNAEQYCVVWREHIHPSPADLKDGAMDSGMRGSESVSWFLSPLLAQNHLTKATS